MGKPNSRIHKLQISNKEIRQIYEYRIRIWFRMKAVGDTERWKQSCTAIKTDNVKTVQELFNVFLSDAISI